MMVKICGITCREDALAAIESGASALGLNFYPKSPRYVSPERAAEILTVVPKGIVKVGVFANEPPEPVTAVASALGLDVVQLHGDSAIPAGLRVWKAISVGPDFSPDVFDAWAAEAFLLDTPAADVYGGTGRTFNWSIVRGISHCVILAGGLDDSNVGEAIRQVRPWGVDACSRLELSPGRKDHARMARFIKAALMENQS